MNVINPFLSGYVASASVPRSAILADLRPRSLMATVVTAIILLPVLLFCTVVFTHLPMCVLATIVLVSLKRKGTNV
jgi:MFS superfamily sulfate permease-like transporter